MEYEGTIIIPFKVEAKSIEEAVDQAMASARYDLDDKPLVESDYSDEELTVTLIG